MGVLYGDKLGTSSNNRATSLLLPFVMFGYYVTFNNTTIEVGIRPDYFVFQLVK